jgi:hypothetical protein
MLQTLIYNLYVILEVVLAKSSFKAWENIAFYLVLISIIFLIISSLAWLFFFKNKSSLKKLQSEKEKLEKELSQKVKSLTEEKRALEIEHEKANTHLFENKRVIETLSQKLRHVTNQYDELKNEFDLNKVQELYTEIKELISRNKSLENLLEDTYNKIYEKDKILGTLESEINSMKHPEVVIDFQKKTITNKDGSEFSLSSAAQQYKNDVFRYLEYIVRNGKSRIHMIEFGLNDPKFFIEAVEHDTVREYNYEGKFAKVKSGINRTFRDNTGKELILHDHDKIYAYCVLPESVLRITSKDKDVEIILSEINRTKMPEVLTFFGYETFDFYKANSEIIIKSNIQDSTEHFQKAFATNDPTEKLSHLETALSLDDRNYEALSYLLDCPECHRVGQVECVQIMRANLAKDIENLQNFLSSKIIYQKKITNMNRIKQEYKEIYSWKFVDSAKSDRFRKLGEKAFEIVLEWEIERMKKRLDSYLCIMEKIVKYFENLKKLESIHHYMRPLIDERVLAKVIVDFAEQQEGARFLMPDQTVNELEFKKGLINYLISAFSGKAIRTDLTSFHSVMIEFIDWLHTHQEKESRDILKNLETFLNGRAISPPDRKKIEQTLKLFINAEDYT